MRAQKLPSIGLAALQHVESFWTRDQTCVPCPGRLHHQGSAPIYFLSESSLLDNRGGVSTSSKHRVGVQELGAALGQRARTDCLEGAEGSQVSPPCLHQVGLTLTVLRMMTTGYCLVEDKRGSAEEAWLRGGQKGTQALGGPNTAGPGCLAGGGTASRTQQGRGWSLGGALSGRDRISTSGRSMAVGGASNRPCVGGATL